VQVVERAAGGPLKTYWRSKDSSRVAVPLQRTFASTTCAIAAITE